MIYYRPLQKAELQQAVDLCAVCFQEDYRPYAEKEFPNAFDPETALNPLIYAAVSDDGRVIGLSVLHRHIATFNNFSLTWVCTHSEFRGQGIASDMVRYCEEQAALLLAGQEGSISFVCREVLIPFYERLGFTGGTILHENRQWMAKVIESTK